MKNISLIKATIQDVGQLQKIGKQTFSEAFASDNTSQDMTAYLEQAFSINQLQQELANQHSQFYFAKDQNQIIGYLKINVGPAQTELQKADTLEIERIYVLKEHYRKGIGQMLFTKAMEIAQHTNIKSVWLGVWKKNPRAIKFYKKNGFKEFDTHIFKLGEDEQTDILMRLDLD